MYNINKEALKNDVYSRKELYILFQKDNKNISYNSFKWIIANLISQNIIKKIDYNKYCCCELERKIYKPIYSKQALEIMNLLESTYPLVDFCVFESVLLNEFLNHQIANNTIIVQVEKEVSAFAFDLLQEKYNKTVLYKPSKKELEKYWCKDCIIVVNKISEAPQNKTNKHYITLEKLIVDIFAEMTIKNLFSESEYPFIMENITDRYYINKNKALRYARRRNNIDKIKNYMK